MHDVVHELRTPLSALRCRLDSISDGISKDPQSEIEGANEEIDHLTRLVEDLHEVALAEARELRLNITEESLHLWLHQQFAPQVSRGSKVAIVVGDRQGSSC